MARELSKLEQEIYSIGFAHLPTHQHPLILKEWEFYGKSKNPYGRLIFSCSKCNTEYFFDLSREEQIKLFNVDGSQVDTDRPYTI